MVLRLVSQTKLGRCLVTSTIRNDFNIIAVVLGADTKRIRTKDSIELIEYVYSNYEYVDIEKLVTEEFENWKRINSKGIYINKGIKSTINLELDDNKFKIYPLKKGKIEDVKIKINSLNYLEAPVEQNKVIGNLRVELDGEIIEDISILNTEEIRKKEIFDYFYEIVSQYDIILKNVF